uniref:E3 ubiquitin-protein ligase Topors n=1 Tax=Anser cygnoides TaxID=8845 RepID=A0A8B9E0Z3_ANSCY
MRKKKNSSPQEGPSGGPHLPATSTLLGSLGRQDTPSRAEEDLKQSGSAGTASGGQMQQAGPSEEAAGERCPICLGTTRNTAYVSTCFHTFCFRCIRRWAATRSTCPLCRQPIDRILHTVRADDDYQQYVCRSSARGRRNAARERVRSRSPQRRYDLRPRPSNNGPAAGRRAPQGIGQADGAGALFLSLSSSSPLLKRGTERLWWSSAA